MAVTQLYPNAALKNIGDGDFSFGTDTFKLMLLANTFSPNIDSDTTEADVEADEIAIGGGYTGAVTLTAVSWLQDNTNDRVAFDFADVMFAASTITARYAAIFKENGGASSGNPLLVIIDFGADQSSSGTTFEIRLNSVGLFIVQQA